MEANWEQTCDGCTACAMRCTDGINISEVEFFRMLDELRGGDLQQARRVLEQEKETPWFEGASYQACLFLDFHTQRCLVYPARPLICRLFGRVAHLPCPIEKVPADLEASHILEAYTSQPLQTFQQWMMAHEIFNFADLLDDDGEPERYEL
ncbi:MAG: YkgJ family cysteine cluster protein [Armatimonadota bacterium]